MKRYAPGRPGPEGETPQPVARPDGLVLPHALPSGIQCLLQAIVDGTQDLIAAQDQDFRFIAFNDAYRDEFKLIFGTEIAIGASMIEALGHLPEDQRIARQLWARALSGEAFTVEGEFGDPDRARNLYEIRFNPIRDLQGVVIGAAHIARNVTDHRRAVEALRLAKQDLEQRVAQRTAELAASERRYRTVADYTFDWEYWLDPDGRLVYVSPSCERVTGYHPQAFIDDPDLIDRLVHPEDRAAWKEHRHLRGEVGETLPIDFRITRRDGIVRWIGHICHQLRDGEGQPLGVRVSNRDITERKHAEESLRASEERIRRLNEDLERQVAARTRELSTAVERLQAEISRRSAAESQLEERSRLLEGFFRHTITPLAFLDRHFNFIRVNAAYAASAKRAPDYFPGKKHFDLYPHAEDQAIYEEVVRTGQPYRVYAKPLAHPDDPGRVTYWNRFLTPLIDENGAVDSLVLNIEDVTPQQNAYHELEHRARQLQIMALDLSQAEDRERRRLAEILHDDLQQVLVAARFHLGLLDRRAGENAPIHAAVADLDRLLKEAIDKSRSLSHELSPAVLYQGSLSETFHWLARQMESRYGLTLQIDARGTVDTRSEALRAFLYRAVLEMLFNVVKHAGVKDARLRIRRHGNVLRLAVCDDGHGFDPRAIGKTGGLGLLGIRERIQLLGGRMRISSAPGRGSRLLFSVPDPQEGASASPNGGSHATRLAHPEHGPGDAPAPRLRVLLVDDHKLVREGLAALLQEQSDIEVVGQAGNGREAVDLAFRLKPQVIIMDVSMPVMQGDEATRQILLHLPETRIIALSMFEEEALLKRMLDAGAEAYLPKAGPAEDLLAAIRAQPPS
ncbi:MAG: PAS domain-containing protein [Candidatus Eisenbacteria bacterium]